MQALINAPMGGGQYRSINIYTNGSIEYFYDDISEFKIPAEQITENSKGVYESYLYKTTRDAKDAVLEIKLKFSDTNSSYFTFRAEWLYTSNSGGGNNGALVDYIKQ